MHVRILTLNVWNSEGDPRRPQLINCALSTLKPDLIAFQEVTQTPEDKMLDRLLAGLDFHATHQAEVQDYAPPLPIGMAAVPSPRAGRIALSRRWTCALQAPLMCRGRPWP